MKTVYCGCSLNFLKGKAVDASSDGWTDGPRTLRGGRCYSVFKNGMYKALETSLQALTLEWSQWRFDREQISVDCKA